jgi:hypothetical protein
MLTILSLLGSMLAPLATAVLVIGSPPPCFAEDIPVATSVRDSVHGKDLAQIRALLEREETRTRLSEAGITVDEAMTRVEGMTPAETHYLAAQMHEIEQRGGDCAGVVIAILIIALLVILILVLLNKSVEVKDKNSHPASEAKSGASVPRGAVIG